ncbi:MAG: ATP-binding protein [bacterium]
MVGPLRVLLVENNRQQARRVGESLKKYDCRFEIETIDSGVAYIEKIVDSGYNAIILDEKSSGPSGTNLLSELEMRGVDAPVVVVTNNDRAEKAVVALKNGAYDYIVKDDSYLSILPKVVQKSIETYHLTARLRESEHKYQNIFEKANDAIFMINLQDHEVHEANLKAAQISGYSKQELLHKQFVDLYPQNQKERVERLLQKTTEQGSYQDDDLSILTKHHDLVPVDINASAITLDKELYILGIVRDIGEKKHLQSLILNSKRRLQESFDGITDIIYQVNRDYEVVLANKRIAELCRTQPEKLIGLKCYEAIFLCQQPCSDCPVEKSFLTRRPAYQEKVNDQEIFEMWSYPIFASGEEIEAVVVYSKNVTEKKRLERSLIQSEKLATIGLLSSGIAHEIRNPLNIIETARYYIEEFMPPQRQDIRAKLSIISKNVKRAAKIINNLLEFSRPSDQEKEKINLNKLLESTINLIEKELHAKNIEYRIGSRGTYHVYLNVESLKQVFLNIIINAVQAMPNGGKLTIEIATPREPWVEIKIADTGHGIPKENLPHIFSPFFTTKDVGVGTGLGLYVSHMIMRREGGEIKVTSTVGQGTTFTILLPRSHPGSASQHKKAGLPSNVGHV